MKGWLSFLTILISTSASAQVFSIVEPKSGKEFEYLETQIGWNMAPQGFFFQGSVEKLIGVKGKFVLPIRASLIVPAAKYREGDQEFWLQAGAGIYIDDLTTVLIYPFWKKKIYNHRYKTGYVTPISLVARYQLPEVSRFKFELWINYYDHNLDVNAQFVFIVTRTHNKNATAKKKELRTF